MDGTPGADGFIDLGVMQLPQSTMAHVPLHAPPVDCAASSRDVSIGDDFFTVEDARALPSARQYEPAPADWSAPIQIRSAQEQSDDGSQVGSAGGDRGTNSLPGLLAELADGMRQVALAMTTKSAERPLDLLQLMEEQDASPTTAESDPPSPQVLGDVLGGGGEDSSSGGAGGVLQPTEPAGPAPTQFSDISQGSAPPEVTPVQPPRLPPQAGAGGVAPAARQQFYAVAGAEHDLPSWESVPLPPDLSAGGLHVAECATRAALLQSKRGGHAAGTPPPEYAPPGALISLDARDVLAAADAMVSQGGEGEGGGLSRARAIQGVLSTYA